MTEVAAHGTVRRRAVTVLVIGTMFWTGGGLIARGAPLGGPQLAFWRSLLGAAIYQSIVIARGPRPTLARVATQLRVCAVAGVGFGLGIVALFMAYKSTTLLDANVIGAIAPLILVPLAARLHGDRLPGIAIVLVLVAFAGTVIAVIGSSNSGAWSLRGDLLAALGVVVSCLYPIGTKSARRTLEPLEFQAGVLWVSAAITLPAAIWLGDGWLWPSARSLGWALALVAIGGTGHLCFSWSQRHLSVADTSTIGLIEIIEVSVAAAIVFDQPISILAGIGMVTVMAAVGGFVRLTAAIEPDEAGTTVLAVGPDR